MVMLYLRDEIQYVKGKGNTKNNIFELRLNAILDF